MPWARPVAEEAVVIRCCGTMTTARTPPYADERRDTWNPYACASRPTTARPSLGVSPRSLRSMPDCACASIFSARPRASSLMLRPPSSISTAMPDCTSTAVRWTRVCGGEYRVALSSSSARVWISGSTTGPTTATSETEWSSTRW